MQKKDQEKYKIEVMKLSNIESLVMSDKSDFKKKGQFALEVHFQNKEKSEGKTDLYYLIAYDVYQIKEWHEAIEKCRAFSNEVKNLIEFVKKNKHVITDSLRLKLDATLLKI